MVGGSMGGMIAQHLGMEHADRTRSLTTIMTTPGGRLHMPTGTALRQKLSTFNLNLDYADDNSALPKSSGHGPSPTGPDIEGRTSDCAPV